MFTGTVHLGLYPPLILQILGLTFLYNSSHTKPKIWQRPFVGTTPELTQYISKIIFKILKPANINTHL